MATNRTNSFIGYLGQARDYLQARGVNPDDTERIRIVAKATADNCRSFYTRHENAIGQVTWTPFVPEGWAFSIRSRYGSFPFDNLLIRVCNWPEEVYELDRKKGSYELCSKPPKFIYQGAREYLNNSVYCASSLSEIAGQDYLVIAEKYTVATIIASQTRIPALGLSGCRNWSKGDKTLQDDAEDAIMSLAPRATVALILDADLTTNHNVFESARAFKMAVRNLRPDVTVYFPQPIGTSGLDDWWVEQGADAAALFEEELRKDGLIINVAYTPEELFIKYGVELEPKGKTKQVVAHTVSNYNLLLLSLPEFRNVICDNVSGEIFADGDYSRGGIPLGAFYVETRSIMEKVVFKDNPKMSRQTLLDVIRDSLIPARTRSVMLDIIDEVEPDPNMTMEMAYVDEFLRSSGITGPMTHDELRAIFLLLARDMVHTWADDPAMRMENFLGLSGPSGVGKTSLLSNMFLRFSEYMGGHTRFVTTIGPNSKPEDFHSATNSCLGVVIDELNPKRRAEGDLLHAIYSAVTEVSYKARDAYAMGGTWHIRHALIALTTVEERYVVGNSDAGAKRRLVPLELAGAVVDDSGEMRPDYNAIADSWFAVLSCARRRMLDGKDLAGKISALSSKYVDDVFDDSTVVSQCALYWTGKHEMLMRDLAAFGRDQMEKDGSVRFTPAQLFRLLMPGDDGRGTAQSDFNKFFLACGAVKRKSKSSKVKNISGAPKNVLEVVGGEAKWREYVHKMISKLS